MSRKEGHFVPNRNGRWDSKRENAERASKHFGNKADAVDWSKKGKERGD